MPLSYDLRDANLIDKALINGSEMALSNTGDIAIVKDEYNILQAAMNRCISVLWTRMYDSSFWNQLTEFTNQNTAYLLTDDIAYSYIEQALKPMMEDGRIQEITKVVVIDRTKDTATIDVQFKIWTQLWTITFDIPTFIQ